MYYQDGVGSADLAFLMSAYNDYVMKKQAGGWAATGGLQGAMNAVNAANSATSTMGSSLAMPGPMSFMSQGTNFLTGLKGLFDNDKGNEGESIGGMTGSLLDAGMNFIPGVGPVLSGLGLGNMAGKAIGSLIGKEEKRNPTTPSGNTTGYIRQFQPGGISQNRDTGIVDKTIFSGVKFKPNSSEPTSYVGFNPTTTYEYKRVKMSPEDKALLSDLLKNARNRKDSLIVRDDFISGLRFDQYPRTRGYRSNSKSKASDKIYEQQSGGYTVKKGDTLWGIGKKYGVNWQDIAKANNITNPRALQIGTNLTIPQNQSKPEVSEQIPEFNLPAVEVTASRIQKEKDKGKQDNISKMSYEMARTKTTPTLDPSLNMYNQSRVIRPSLTGAYRSGNVTPETLEEFKRTNPDVKKVIYLKGANENKKGSRGINKAKIESMGFDVEYLPIGRLQTEGEKRNFEKAVDEVKKGNVLVMCEHGFDRTGAVCAQAALEKGYTEQQALQNNFWDTDKGLYPNIPGKGEAYKPYKDVLKAPYRSEAVNPAMGRRYQKGGFYGSTYTNKEGKNYNNWHYYMDPENQQFLKKLEEKHDLPEGYLTAIAFKETGRVTGDKVDGKTIYTPQNNLTSHVGAQGPFQFMPSTAQSYGLEDPFDFKSSAVAAAKKLRKNLDQFGSPQAAAAAYNMGSSGLRRYFEGKRNLPRETREYIPRMEEHWLNTGGAVSSLPNDSDIPVVTAPRSITPLEPGAFLNYPQTDKALSMRSKQSGGFNQSANQDTEPNLEIEGKEFVFKPEGLNRHNDFKMLDNTGIKHISPFGFEALGKKHKGDNSGGIKVKAGDVYIASEYLGVNAKKAGKGNPSVAKTMLKYGGKALAKGFDNAKDKFGINSWNPGAVKHHLKMMTTIRDEAERNRKEKFVEDAIKQLMGNTKKSKKKSKRKNNSKEEYNNQAFLG